MTSPFLAKRKFTASRLLLTRRGRLGQLVALGASCCANASLAASCRLVAGRGTLSAQPATGSFIAIALCRLQFIALRPRGRLVGALKLQLQWSVLVLEMGFNCTALYFSTLSHRVARSTSMVGSRACAKRRLLHTKPSQSGQR